MMVEALGRVSHWEERFALLNEAFAAVDANSQYWCEAELHRLHGELLLDQAPSDERQAEVCFHRALEISRHQQGKSFELRAAISLARLWQSQSKYQDAYDLLASVYEWFTEGFDMADLVEAKVLLDELRK